jgi:phosphoribosylformylglycinamidine synthase PurS subunit
LASKFEVIVAYKPEVLDTQARAIHGTLNRIGYETIKAVQVNKRFILEIDAESSDAEQQARQIAEKVLANPVSEQYQVRRLE